jgi:cobalt-zinc-cadmium efflux system outer membrane protein
LTLAHRRWIPDPSLRVGYLRDQFVISGNQPNSLFVGLTLPLPFLDHGQADAQAARAQAASAREARTLLLAQAQRELERLSDQAAATERRRAQLEQKTLPLAKTLGDRLEAAVQRGAAPLQELLLTRRTYGELLLDASELDLSAFQLANARARAGGETPPVPAALQLQDESISRRTR